ncbi:MAG: hypothetical protein GY835_23695 [bacterium]|nr:hypothetical protein [bacterium]
MELPAAMDPHDLAQTGWGIIFARDENPEVRHHLRRLLDHRQEQAGERYKELTYNTPESARSFLWYRHGVAPGVLDTNTMPYYLLIIGDPATISFEFQYQLCINHAVGRLHFQDPKDYARYADSVVIAETVGVSLSRRFTVFSVENDDNTSTSILASSLVEQLLERLTDYSSNWAIDAWCKEKATKRNLTRLLGGKAPPGLLFISCDALRFPADHSQQHAYQGALLCQDWGGGPKRALRSRRSTIFMLKMCPKILTSTVKSYS